MICSYRGSPTVSSAFSAGLSVPPLSLSMSESSYTYLEQLRVLILLILKFLFKLIHFLFQTIKIDLQLLLNPYMLAYLSFRLLDCALQGLIVLLDYISAFKI